MQGEVDLGYVGEITEVNTKPILDALNNGYVPVIATVASGEDGQTYNINADTAAARIAACLKAENLILMTDIVGLLEDMMMKAHLFQQLMSVKCHTSKTRYYHRRNDSKIDCCVEAVSVC